MIIEITTEKTYEVDLTKIYWLTPVIYDEFKKQYCIELKMDVLGSEYKYIYSNDKELLKKHLQFIKDWYQKNEGIVFPELKKNQGNVICDFQLPIDFL